MFSIFPFSLLWWVDVVSAHQFLFMGLTISPLYDIISPPKYLKEYIMEISFGKFVPTKCSILENKDTYCDLLFEICKEKFGERGFEKVTAIIKWLEATDFFDAPASSMFHENYPGGLVEHTLRVYNNAMELLRIAPFKDCNMVSVALCALVHDWCKIGLYKQDWKNVKNETTGQWEKQAIYKKVDPNVPLGHGTTSMYMALRFFNLTVEEALAIRWHMGEYHICQDERGELHAANETYPMVQLIQFADRLACTTFSV